MVREICQHHGVCLSDACGWAIVVIGALEEVFLVDCVFVIGWLE